MYFENPSEVNQRVSYYSVVSVPFSILDGNVYAGPSNSFTTSISGLVDSRISVSPRYAIKKLSLFVSGNQLKGSFQFTSGHAANSSEILVAHIVAIERNVSKSDYAASPGSNNETEYGYVMRKMIPDANGTALLNTSLAGKDTVMFSWTLNHIKNTGELRVVAFVQNFSTKEVYQAQFFVVDNTPVGMKEPESAPALDLKVFPNPLKDSFTLLFNGVTVLKELSITDPVGKTVYALTINASTDRILVEPRLNPGLYLLKISTGDQTLIKKILVAH